MSGSLQIVVSFFSSIYVWKLSLYLLVHLQQLFFHAHLCTYFDWGISHTCGGLVWWHTKNDYGLLPLGRDYSSWLTYNPQSQSCADILWSHFIPMKTTRSIYFSMINNCVLLLSNSRYLDRSEVIDKTTFAFLTVFSWKCTYVVFCCSLMCK